MTVGSVATSPVPPSNEQQQALRVLDRDFGVFDTAGEGGSQDGKISRKDLEAVRDGEGFTAEQRQAARYLLEHADQLDRLDVAAEGGDTDGIVSRDDATRYILDHRAELPDDVVASAEARQILEVGRRDGRDDYDARLAAYTEAMENAPSDAYREALFREINHQDVGAQESWLQRERLDRLGPAGEERISQAGHDALAAFLPHPVADKDDLPVLGTQTVQGSDVDPTVLHIDAEAPGSSWSNPGTDKAGTVSIYVDGEYYADATVFSENPDGVDVNLGALGSGPHTIELRDSSSGASLTGPRVQLNGASARTLSGDEALIARYAPIVHLEDNEQAGNNTPLFTTAQVTDNGDGTTTIEYRVLYSNEDDGHGKHPHELAGKWGRLTDHEQVYTFTVDGSGEIVRFESKSLGNFEDDPNTEVNEVQAALQDRTGSGRPEVVIKNGHNQYAWATDGGYADRADNRVFSGAPVNLEDRTDIELMNDHPWTWEVSNAEIAREGETAEVQPYQRLYLSLPDGHARDIDKVEVQLADGRWITVETYDDGWLGSLGEHRLNDSRAVSIVLPEGIAPADVTAVRVTGLPDDAEAQAQYLTPANQPIEIPVV